MGEREGMAQPKMTGEVRSVVNSFSKILKDSAENVPVLREPDVQERILAALKQKMQNVQQNGDEKIRNNFDLFFREIMTDEKKLSDFYGAIMNESITLSPPGQQKEIPRYLSELLAYLVGNCGEFVKEKTSWIPFSDPEYALDTETLRLKVKGFGSGFFDPNKPVEKKSVKSISGQLADHSDLTMGVVHDEARK